jgi:hypothetical protein
MPLSIRHLTSARFHVNDEAERNPMLAFTLERGLLPLELNTPAFAPLFQLPPRLKQR